MLNKYRLTMPTAERARELGFRFPDLCSRTNTWLSGVDFTVKAIDSSIVFNITDFVQPPVGSRYVEFETDSILLFEQIWNCCKNYGMTCCQVLPDGKTIEMR